MPFKAASLPWQLGLFLGALLLPPAVQASRSVNVALSASFSSPPYLLELLETAAEENSTSYFPLLDRIADGAFAESRTDKDLYDQFLRVLRDEGHIRDPDALSSFKLAMSLRSTAPRIQAHYQYYNTSVEQSLMVVQDAVCQVWAHYGGEQHCSPSLKHAQQSVSGDQDDHVLPFDRVLGRGDQPLVLYADISSPLFGDFHKELSKRAVEGEFSYRVRYRPSSLGHANRLFVSGYGVELALKRTDYIVIDDRDAEQSSSSSSSSSEKAKATHGTAKDLKEESPADLKPLSASEVSTLGINAASFIMNSEDPFETLLKLSQDFPRHSSIIANTNATIEFLVELANNQAHMLPAGYNVMWINGVQLDPRRTNAFSLLNHLRYERKVINNFRELDLSAGDVVRLLAHPVVARSQAIEEAPRYDYRDETEGGGVIIWLNDLEKDRRYSNWSRGLAALLQRTYPGQFPQARRDVNNVIVLLNLADRTDLRMLVSQLQMFITRKIPIRFGMVPTLPDEASMQQIRVASYLHQTYGLKTLLTYFENALEGAKSQIVWPSKDSFNAAVQDREHHADRPKLTFEEILSSDHFEPIITKTKAYLKRLSSDGPNPPMFVNGAIIPRDEHWMQPLVTRLAQDLEEIQQAIYGGLYDDDSWLPIHFLDGAVLTRNPLIIPEDPGAVQIRDLHAAFKSRRSAFDALPRIRASSDSNLENWSSLILIADFDSEGGIKQLGSVLEFREKNPGIEVLLLHDSHLDFSGRVSAELFNLMKESRDVDVSALKSILEVGSERLLTQEPDVERRRNYFSSFSPLARELGSNQGGVDIVFNGRLIGPIPSSSLFGVQELEQLLAYERQRRLEPLFGAVKSLELKDVVDGPFKLARLTSLVARSTKLDIPEDIYDSGPALRTNSYEKWSTEHSGFMLSHADDPVIQVVAVIDPASEAAQRYIPILKVLSKLSGVSVKVILSPIQPLKELPIKRFYRQVFESEPSFNDDGSLRRPEASFTSIPEDALLTLGMDVAPSWLVAPKESVYDLDNIKLSSLREGANVDAVYELEHILIEGHSRDVTHGSPPRGVQLLLGTEKTPHFADTIIMANLGYFQFKAQPGCWRITLKPGPSERIYQLDSVGGMGYVPKPGDETNEVALLSFQGTTLFPRLSRKPGHEEDDVLEAGSKAGSVKNYFSKGLNFASDVISSITGSQKEKHADINIFSVASGHLYERMLNIMMVSVMRHTKHSVKFWFIEQFLSPSFKSFLPHLAKEYGFSYEMVTYKWPHWLRSQREKQREIWGYKILFLDVLFPLSLDKVIFVDADQIVRTDMYDLITMDLDGAPYGFTPMCDSRTEMEGFRFWKQGYWKKFLKGLPYHISALYVVDLNRFRELAAGDRLRGQYQSLSADPNSLANLDQDLPNHMQHAIPIKSLSQDWLWCETWCSDEALKTARTIDLCNNPMTKEPKLERARRQVPEWTEYDDEIAELGRRVAREQGQAGDEKNEKMRERDEL
ncbi:UDP-glucose:Glycoprotein Glucosyltransferase containing protein [Coccidioides posadasii C735 delta SOWgp]|uniref:UDP-glucose:glycoprotein glucosyltransferase n=2 Tax=Coccidioides posadasii TaxID=199306 RepID=A0A0J6F392_COCPO|nr:UDP-glucose:Glycoprotein Glucosyltransferase containing protein [Coccidioides posadasii C735 delta SOWgp]EER23278.1 UDP-glucose:Glycoprotein Glucosyltransferase containing protein [Coccidioides posadasii C735 delta SOWgp]KMM64593.1 UDP-glucose:glycoprotein glucosyltransferase [Coccidioides posadasii RMSCC 3488]|eukprot:XP_003065423.1 UDP-glucose:Glycoprotein Glucosyltransferase containing protein [Coccidioides posadasii C735 delta SOWgp]